LFQITARPLYGIQDPLCGMKGYRMELYGALGWFDSYRSIGTELMLHAMRHRASPSFPSPPASAWATRGSAGSSALIS
jgi:hypothetical protein